MGGGVMAVESGESLEVEDVTCATFILKYDKNQNEGNCVGIFPLKI